MDSVPQQSVQKKSLNEHLRHLPIILAHATNGMKKYNFFFCHSFLKTSDEKIRYLTFLWRSDHFTRFYLTERYQNGSSQGLRLQFLEQNVWKMECNGLSS